MLYSIIIDIQGMLWAVEWKRLFSALKISKIGFIWVRSKIPFLWEIFVVDMSRIDIFSQVRLKSGVLKTASLLTVSIRGFFYSPQSYMINVLKINCGLLPEEMIHITTMKDE